MSMVYEWGTRRFPVEAQVVGEKVERLAGANGGVCPPSALVDEARDEESPLHPLFTWQDDVAAEAWRRQEARNVVRYLRVKQGDSDRRPPAFLHVAVMHDDEPREGYAPFSVVMDNSDQKQQAVDEALRYLRGFMKRYEHLTELEPVFDAIARVDEHEAA